MRDLREPLREPPVNAIGEVLGLVGADIVAEGHPCGDDQVIRAQVHGAQVEQRVDARCLLDLGPAPAMKIPNAASSDQK